MTVIGARGVGQIEGERTMPPFRFGFSNEREQRQGEPVAYADELN